MWWTSKCENIKFEPVVFSAAETVFLCLCVFKVFQVEEEMRQLLEETETNKRIMEEKMKRLTSVLKDF